MTRRIFAVATAPALALALYAALGYWMAPGYVREALAGLAADRGLTLDLTAVRTDPFALRVELEGVALRGPDGRVFAQAAGASADLAWASLWHRAWIVDEARLAAPQIELGGVPALRSPPPTDEAAAPAALTVRRLTIEEGRLTHAGAQLEIEALGLQARDLSTLDAAAGTYEAAARLAGGAGQIASRGTLALAPLAAEGSLSVAALRAARLLPEAKGQLQGEARYAYAGGELVLRDVALSGSELAYAGVELPQAMLRAKEMPIPPRAPVEVAAQASVAPHGKLAAQGRVQFAPLELQLNLNAESLPLVVAERWLPPHTALRIVSGIVSGTGLLDLAGGAAAYHGSATIGGLRLEERESGALLLAWENAATDSLTLDTQPFSLRAGEIALRAPEGRLEIHQNGTVNFARVLAGDEDDGGGTLQAMVERLRIEDGTLHFADRSLANPFEVTLRELAGAMTGLQYRLGRTGARTAEWTRAALWRSAHPRHHRPECADQSRGHHRQSAQPAPGGVQSLYRQVRGLPHRVRSPVGHAALRGARRPPGGHEPAGVREACSSARSSSRRDWSTCRSSSPWRCSPTRRAASTSTSRCAAA